MKIKDKVIIVTGASEGIGEATAKILASKGAKLVLAARSGEKLKMLAKGLPDAIAVVTDMRKPKEINRLIVETLKKYGRIDILINNAGQGMYGPIEKIDIDKYKEVMELNVYGVVRAMQAVIPQMRAQGGGMILNVSSMVSKNYFPWLAAYASTKYALNAISLTARQELAQDNIIVSVFHPKMTATNFGKNAIGARPDWASEPDDDDRQMPEIDSAQEVAKQIAEQIVSEKDEAGM